MSLNSQVLDRLVNWKFSRAVEYLDEETTDEERELIEALSSAFGNVGWGLEGAMGVIASAALSTLDGRSHGS